ncbi:MAG: hypothetical protein J1F22_07990 [Lachnospiraceae bacterium]|nr:hypothetical protein [Lachnospiraceae bacterium]
MKRKILSCIIVLCAFMVACSGVSKDYLQSSEIFESATDSTRPSETPEINCLNEIIHEQYIKAMIESATNNDIMNYIGSDGKFTYPYAFYDIDRNGIDELIISGSYYNYSIYTCQNEEVVGLNWNKYGGNLKIYPEEGIVFWTGGHKDYYYETYFKISEATVKEVAEKSWHVKLTENSQTVDKSKYKIMNKSVKKSEYKKYIASLQEKEIITHKQLKWYR